MDIALGEEVVEVHGEVMRHVPQDNGRIAVGIHFDRLAPRVERSLREFLLKRPGQEK